ncbi:hypothetical protein [Metabacillus malikii]|uniref:Uncharacterized membrane protein HdeD (DUF308 family) n=1 Tax=Metabacillus malikii TaxID=1504265 RepID=A0ABT9ZM16_9BACI|nr:hypothetical protein [Metabacillus malikii]MDQ0233312.1 uncharacterized membrane protein HdeD (DUF308 family) [Metabacillus malikii]
MFTRKKSAHVESKQLSLIYLIIGGCLIFGNLIIVYFEGISTSFYLSTVSGVLFMVNGVFIRVKGAKDSSN